jgi:hypothetical protein
MTCDLIKKLCNNSFNNNWLLMGDFNLILDSKEKYGGSNIDFNTTSLFRSTLNSCDLQDLGFNGDIFTWINKHQWDQLIKCRLDRFIANSDWINCFPFFNNTHLLRYKSDHSSILLVFSEHNSSNQLHKKNKPLRYEQVWMRDDFHVQMVKNSWNNCRGPVHQKLNSTLHSLHKWGSSRFGMIPKKIKAIQEDLGVLNENNGQNNLTSQINDK